MAPEHILLAISDHATGQLLERGVLQPAGYQVSAVPDLQSAAQALKKQLPDLLILSDRFPAGNGLDFGAQLLEDYPFLPILLLPNEHSENLPGEALRRGFAGYLKPPLRPQQAQQVIAQTLERRRKQQAWIEARLKEHQSQEQRLLEQRLESLEELHAVGRQVTASLDLDSVLTAVVDAAVRISGAEEGLLLLLDENTGELYSRAARNLDDEFVRTFRLPVQDSLAGQVIISGQPLLLDEQTPQKIKTAYLVYSLLYVPMRVQGRVIGVLGVDNRERRATFNESQIALISTLADYAAIAVENARLYSRSEAERSKLESILTHLKEGVWILDQDHRILLVNPTARKDFNLAEDENLLGKRIQDVVQNEDFLELFTEPERSWPARREITLDDDRVLNAQLTPIPDVGLAITMQDITHLKELDKIKSDFVNTVSHDLRSPLTAILGYVELIERVGPVNEQQKMFIDRVDLSVQHIASLINDLLDLGRIEAGFDTQKDRISLHTIIHYSIEGLRGRIEEKSQNLVVNVAEDLPLILGNPIRIRQMVVNLLGNASKYTPEGGQIRIDAQAEGDQIIIRVSDTGVGIPPADQPYIFDKFYRSSNVPENVTGTGLGLSIVKSIVENHRGRIWVDSTPGKGSTFTVVLPAAGRDD